METYFALAGRLRGDLREYIELGRQTVQASWVEWPIFSFAADEANIRVLSLSSAALVCPSNKSMWLPCRLAVAPHPRAYPL